MKAKVGILNSMSIEGGANKRSSQNCRSILHVGAHRTGTTLFQEFLYRRRNAALEGGFRFIETVECRKNGLLDGIIYNRTSDKIYLRDKQIRLRDNLSSSLDQNMRLVFSEENLLGSMQKCARMGSLYPDAYDMVSRLGDSLEVFDTILISVRPIHTWWQSVHGFFRKSGQTIEPNMTPREITKILEGRTWSHVVQDIKSVAGSKAIIVRDFDYFISNPKRQLLGASRWMDLKKIPGIEKKVSNSSPPISIRFDAAQKEFPEKHTEFCVGVPNSNQAADLDAFYLKDLEEVKRIIGRNGRVLLSKQR